MTPDELLDAGVLIFGVAISGFGLWAYTGKTAGRRFEKWIGLGNPYLTHSSVMLLLPTGVGSTVIGLAFVIGKNAFTQQMLVAGLFLFVLGWILYFVHPSWVQPRWMRRR